MLEEVCAIGSDAFDNNSAATFQVMSNELATPILLVCPRDRSRKPAPNFPSLANSNITYHLRSGAEISDRNPTNVLALCPICGNILRCDGSVNVVTDDQRSQWQLCWESLRFDRKALLSLVQASLIALLGSVFVWFALFPRRIMGFRQS